MKAGLGASTRLIDALEVIPGSDIDDRSGIFKFCSKLRSFYTSISSSSENEGPKIEAPVELSEALKQITKEIKENVNFHDHGKNDHAVMFKLLEKTIDSLNILKQKEIQEPERVPLIFLFVEWLKLFPVKGEDVSEVTLEIHSLFKKISDFYNEKYMRDEQSRLFDRWHIIKKNPEQPNGNHQLKEFYIQNKASLIKNGKITILEEHQSRNYNNDDGVRIFDEVCQVYTKEESFKILQSYHGLIESFFIERMLKLLDAELLTKLDYYSDLLNRYSELCFKNYNRFDIESPAAKQAAKILLTSYQCFIELKKLICIAGQQYIGFASEDIEDGLEMILPEHLEDPKNLVDIRINLSRLRKRFNSVPKREENWVRLIHEIYLAILTDDVQSLREDIEIQELLSEDKSNICSQLSRFATWSGNALHLESDLRFMAEGHDILSEIEKHTSKSDEWEIQKKIIRSVYFDILNLFVCRSQIQKSSLSVPTDFIEDDYSNLLKSNIDIIEREVSLRDKKRGQIGIINGWIDAASSIDQSQWDQKYKSNQYDMVLSQCVKEFRDAVAAKFDDLASNRQDYIRAYQFVLLLFHVHEFNSRQLKDKSVDINTIKPMTEAFHDFIDLIYKRVFKKDEDSSNLTIDLFDLYRNKIILDKYIDENIRLMLKEISSSNPSSILNGQILTNISKSLFCYGNIFSVLSEYQQIENYTEFLLKLRRSKLLNKDEFQLNEENIIGLMKIKWDLKLDNGVTKTVLEKIIAIRHDLERDFASNVKALQVDQKNTSVIEKSINELKSQLTGLSEPFSLLKGLANSMMDELVNIWKTLTSTRPSQNVSIHNKKKKKKKKGKKSANTNPLSEVIKSEPKVLNSKSLEIESEAFARSEAEKARHEAESKRQAEDKAKRIEDAEKRRKTAEEKRLAQEKVKLEEAKRKAEEEKRKADEIDKIEQAKKSTSQVQPKKGSSVKKSKKKIQREKAKKKHKSVIPNELGKIDDQLSIQSSNTQDSNTVETCIVLSPAITDENIVYLQDIEDALDSLKLSEEIISNTDNDYLRPGYQVTVPVDAQYVLNALTNAGNRAFIVGGFPRDALVRPDLKPNDFDIITDASEDCLIKVLDPDIKESRYRKGLYPFKYNGQFFDISIKPKCFELFDDAVNRDLTVNAIYCDKNGQIYSPLYSSLADLNARLLKVISASDEIENRFQDDPIKMLRIIQLKHKLFLPGEEWIIDINTYAEIHSNIGYLNDLSYGRLTSHLAKMFMNGQSALNFLEFIHCRVFDVLFQVGDKPFSTHLQKHPILYSFLLKEWSKYDQESDKRFYSMLALLAFPSVVNHKENYQCTFEDAIGEVLFSLREQYKSDDSFTDKSVQYFRPGGVMQKCLAQLVGAYEQAYIAYVQYQSVMYHHTNNLLYGYTGYRNVVNKPVNPNERTDDLIEKQSHRHQY